MEELEDTESVRDIKLCDKGKIMSRKVGEKMRRDRLNGLLATLAEEVPFVANSHRRLDKTAILRLTVSFLKLHHGLKRKRLQKFLPDGPFSGLIEHAVSGSLLIASESGEILFVSPNIRDIVGHNQTDLIGQNISAFIHPDDLQVFKSQFQERPPQTSSVSCASFQANKNIDGASNMDLLESSGSENFSIYIRMSRALKKRSEHVEHKEYELFSVRGHIDKPTEIRKSLFDDLQLMWMVAVLKPVGRQSIREVDVGMSEFLKNNEWATQHGLDGKLWTVDHRGTLFHGYMVSEVLGCTPYLFIKDEDLEYVARSHKLIMKENEIPSTIFRMKNKYKLNLYIQSRSIIINDRWTKQPKCIVSVNTVLSEEHGKLLLEEQRIRVEKLTAQTEQLAITDIKKELVCQSPADTIKLKNSDIPTSDSGDEMDSDCGGSVSHTDEEKSMRYISDESDNGSIKTSGEDSTTSCGQNSRLNSCSCSHNTSGTFTSSGSEDSFEFMCHSPTCQCNKSAKGLNLTGREVNAVVSPASLSYISTSSPLLSYGLKRPREDLETESSETDEEDITRNSFEASGPHLKSFIPDLTQTHQTHCSAHSHKCSVTNESNSLSQNQSKSSQSYPVLKQMLFSKSALEAKSALYSIDRQFGISVTGSHKDVELKNDYLKTPMKVEMKDQDII